MQYGFIYTLLLYILSENVYDTNTHIIGLFNRYKIYLHHIFINLYIIHLYIEYKVVISFYSLINRDYYIVQ